MGFRMDSDHKTKKPTTEERLEALERWQQHMQGLNPQHVPPHTEGPLIDEEGRADLNRARSSARPAQG